MFSVQLSVSLKTEPANSVRNNDGNCGNNDGGNGAFREIDDNVESQHSFNFLDRPNDGLHPLRALLPPERNVVMTRNRITVLVY